MLNFLKKIQKKTPCLKNYKLCFIGYGPTAYFTIIDPLKQEGEKWHSLNYEHNAGEPYGSDDNKQIIKVKFQSSFKTPDEIGMGRFSGYSVVEINSRIVPWLTPDNYIKRPCRNIRR